MSNPQAVALLGKIAAKRCMSVDEVEALYMAARNLTKRHFQRMKNRARHNEERKAEKAGEEN